jgi:predicted Zn-dependent protease
MRTCYFLNRTGPRPHPALIKITLAGALLASTLSGCTTNPATGQQVFTGVTSEAEQSQIGLSQHKKITKAFGGEYGGPELRRYIDSIGQLLAQTVERRQIKYRFTILDSGIVNAFAMPGGLIYISRGLLALAENEAEVAGVLAHELGHINALHHRQRAGQGQLSSLGLGLLGVFGGSSAAKLGDLLVSGALSSWSRDHERESDRLALRYMARAGFDPAAMGSFLRKMRANSRLEARQAGRSPDKVDEQNYLATHPAPIERVNQVGVLAKSYRVQNPIVARDIYLNRIDGMIWGDSPAQGFIKGQVFAHPVQRFQFSVPEGFQLRNSPKAVIAKHQDGSLIAFDATPRPVRGTLRDYLRKSWGRKLRLQDIETLSINGLEAATATTRRNASGGQPVMRMIVIRKDAKTVYRFRFLATAKSMRRHSTEFRRTTYSFRLLSNAEAQALKPLRLRTRKPGRGETLATLARRSGGGGKFSEERLRVINGLGPRDRLPRDQRVKIIAE